MISSWEKWRFPFSLFYLVTSTKYDVIKLRLLTIQVSETICSKRIYRWTFQGHNSHIGLVQRFVKTVGYNGSFAEYWVPKRKANKANGTRQVWFFRTHYYRAVRFWNWALHSRWYIFLHLKSVLPVKFLLRRMNITKITNWQSMDSLHIYIIYKIWAERKDNFLFFPFQ